MSLEQLKTFLEKVKDDDALQNQLKSAANPEQVVEIARQEGFVITAEDFVQSYDLSFQDLEALAGGGHSGAPCQSVFTQCPAGCNE